MISGTGVDILDIARMEKAWQRHGQRFARRILTPQEQQEFDHSRQPIRFLAKRFVAKEAVAKALGTGFQQGLSWQHIEVGHDRLGKPLIFLSLPKHFSIPKQCHISLSDSEHQVIAFVVLEN